MTSGVEADIHVNTLEITSLEAIPAADSLPDGLLPASLLDSVVTDSTRNRFSCSVELVISTNGHEWTIGDAVGRFEDYGAGAAPPQKILISWK